MKRFISALSLAGLLATCAPAYADTKIPNIICYTTGWTPDFFPIIRCIIADEGERA